MSLSSLSAAQQRLDALTQSLILHASLPASAEPSDISPQDRVFIFLVQPLKIIGRTGPVYDLEDIFLPFHPFRIKKDISISFPY